MQHRRWGRWVILWVAAQSALSACAVIDETTDGPVIRAGSVKGAEAIDVDELTSGLDQHPPEGWFVRTYARYDPLQVSLDRQRIVSFYRDRGYFDARVVDVEVSEVDDGVRVDFVVEEGPAFKIRNLRVTGTATTSQDPRVAESLAAVHERLIVGETFVYDRFASAKETVTQAYTRAGYAHANVDGEVAVFSPDDTVEITIDVDPGPLVRFGTVTIDPGPLPEDSIRARLAFEPGDLYDPTLVAQTEGRIYELGMVGVVSFYLPTEGRPEVMDVRIEVRPGKRNELRVGLGIARQNPNYQMRFRTGYVRRDFFDPLVSISTEVRPAVLYRPSDTTFSFGIEWSASVSREDLFIPRLTGTGEVQYNLLQYEAYSTLGPAVRLIANRPFFDDRLRMSIAANFKLFDFPRVDGAVPRDEFGFIGLPICDDDCLPNGTPGGLTLIYLEPAVTFDGRDDPFDPSEGGYARLQFEFGRTLDERGITWMKLTPDVRGYVPLWKRRLVFAARTRLGVKLLPGEPLPATQRYFGGGSESQRGFTIRQLSPFFGEGDGAVPVGGESLFEMSAELRFQIVKVFGMWLGVVAFVDAADVGSDFTALDFLEPHVATGGGLRLYTPIGPIRFDVGYRLNRVEPGVEPGGSDRIAFHFSLGEAF